MAQPEEGCVSPAPGPIKAPEAAQATDTPETNRKESVMTARVGHPAPDFEATALHQGAFKNIRLSEYLGKWVVLCFYPGDFTFV